MRISDWSSDWCSSDLGECVAGVRPVDQVGDEPVDLLEHGPVALAKTGGVDVRGALVFRADAIERQWQMIDQARQLPEQEVECGRSEEGRGGQECCSRWWFRWSPDP